MVNVTIKMSFLFIVFTVTCDLFPLYGFLIHEIKANTAIGTDIPAGTFNVCFDGNYSSRFRAYDADQDWDNSFTDPRVEILATRDNASSVIILKEGMVVKVEYNPVIMKKTGDGLVFD